MKPAPIACYKCGALASALLLPGVRRLKCPVCGARIQ